MKVTGLLAAIVLSALLVGRPAAMAAQAGALDHSFGIAGKRVISTDKYQGSEGQHILRDGAGRIHLLMSRNNSPEPHTLEITRLHHDGALDMGYGKQGMVTSTLPPYFFDITAAEMQHDGRIVAAFQNTLKGVGICRLAVDGTLDPSFGDLATPGCTLQEAFQWFPAAIVVQPDGGIVIAGYDFTDNIYWGFVARLDANGTPDVDFGESGVYQAENRMFRAIARAPDGDVVVAGLVGWLDTDFLVMRLDGEEGLPIDNFGNSGTVIASFGFSHDYATDVAVLSNGDIVAAGEMHTNLPGGKRPAVIKLTANGSPAPGFGTDGKRAYDPCSSYASGCQLSISDVSVLPNEQLVLAGNVSAAAGYYNYDFLAMRLLANGEPDPGFGHPAAIGMVTVPFNLGPDEISPDIAHTVLLEGERILLGGTARVATGDQNNPYREDFALARLDHGLDKTFTVTPVSSSGGALSPATPQQVLHSSRVEFVVLPKPGFVVAGIGESGGDCGGGMDGAVYVTAPITANCNARVLFKQDLPTVFIDSFE